MYTTLQVLNWFLEQTKIPFQNSELSSKVAGKKRILILNELGESYFKSGYIFLSALSKINESDAKLEKYNEKFFFLIQKRRIIKLSATTARNNWLLIFEYLKKLSGMIQFKNKEILRDNLKISAMKGNMKALVIFTNLFYSNLLNQKIQFEDNDDDNNETYTDQSTEIEEEEEEEEDDDDEMLRRREVVGSNRESNNNQKEKREMEDEREDDENSESPMRRKKVSHESLDDDEVEVTDMTTKRVNVNSSNSGRYSNNNSRRNSSNNSRRNSSNNSGRNSKVDLKNPIRSYTLPLTKSNRVFSIEDNEEVLESIDFTKKKTPVVDSDSSTKNKEELSSSSIRNSSNSSTSVKQTASSSNEKNNLNDSFGANLKENFQENLKLDMSKLRTHQSIERYKEEQNENPSQSLMHDVKRTKTIDSFLIFSLANAFRLKKKEALVLLTKKIEELNEIIRHPGENKMILDFFEIVKKNRKRAVKLLAKEEIEKNDDDEKEEIDLTKKKEVVQSSTPNNANKNKKFPKTVEFLSVLSFGLESDSEEVVYSTINIFNYFLSSNLEFFDANLKYYWKNWVVPKENSGSNGSNLTIHKSFLDVLIFAINRNSFKPNLQTSIYTLFGIIIQPSLNNLFFEIENRFESDPENFLNFLKNLCSYIHISSKRNRKFLSLIISYLVMLISELDLTPEIKPTINEEKKTKSLDSKKFENVLFVNCVELLELTILKCPGAVSFFKSNTIIDKLGNKLNYLIENNLVEGIKNLLRIYYLILRFSRKKKKNVATATTNAGGNNNREIEILEGEIVHIYYNTLINIFKLNNQNFKFLVLNFVFEKLLFEEVSNFPIKIVLFHFFENILKIGYDLKDLEFLLILIKNKNLNWKEGVVILRNISELTVKNSKFFKIASEICIFLINRFNTNKKILLFTKKFIKNSLVLLYYEENSFEKKKFDKDLIVKIIIKIIKLKNRIINKIIDENMNKIREIKGDTNDEWVIIKSQLEKERREIFDKIEGGEWLNNLNNENSQILKSSDNLEEQEKMENENNNNVHINKMEMRAVMENNQKHNIESSNYIRKRKKRANKKKRKYILDNNKNEYSNSYAMYRSRSFSTPNKNNNNGRNSNINHEKLPDINQTNRKSTLRAVSEQHYQDSVKNEIIENVILPNLVKRRNDLRKGRKKRKNTKLLLKKRREEIEKIKQKKENLRRIKMEEKIKKEKWLNYTTNSNTSRNKRKKKSVK